MNFDGRFIGLLFIMLFEPGCSGSNDANKNDNTIGESEDTVFETGSNANDLNCSFYAVGNTWSYKVTAESDGIAKTHDYTFTVIESGDDIVIEIINSFSPVVEHDTYHVLNGEVIPISIETFASDSSRIERFNFLSNTPVCPLPDVGQKYVIEHEEFLEVGQTFTVIARSSSTVTVPAGTFATIKLDFDGTFKHDDSLHVSWELHYLYGIGTIRDLTVGTTTKNLFELSSYSLN